MRLIVYLLDVTYVARTPPKVPTLTIQAVATALTAGPEESRLRQYVTVDNGSEHSLLIPQDIKPGPPGNAPTVIK